MTILYFYYCDSTYNYNMYNIIYLGRVLKYMCKLRPKIYSTCLIYIINEYLTIILYNSKHRNTIIDRNIESNGIQITENIQ